MSRFRPRRRRTDAYLAKRLREFERRCLVRILRRVEGNMSAAAKAAGRDRASFYGLVRGHGIDPRSFRPKQPEPKPSKQAPQVSAARQSREWFGVSVAASK